MHELENYDTRRNKLSEALKDADSLVLQREIAKALLTTDICYDIYREVTSTIEAELESIDEQFQDLRQGYQEVVSHISNTRNTEDRFEDLGLTLENIREDEEASEGNNSSLIQSYQLLNAAELIVELISTYQLLNEVDEELEDIEKHLKEGREEFNSHLEGWKIVTKYCVQSILNEAIERLDNEVFGAHDDRVVIQAVQEILTFAISISPVGPVLSAFQAIKNMYKSRIEKIEKADSLLYSFESYTQSALIWALITEASLFVHKRGTNSSMSDILSESKSKIRQRVESHPYQLE